MLAKKSELQKAIFLRKQGKSYSEIASEVLVSKSSLSLWLRNVHLEQDMVQILKDKSYKGRSKGGLARKNWREDKEKDIIKRASQEIDNLTKRELLLMGVMAYWCEGTKQRVHNISQPVVFSNSDPFLIKLFIRWLKEICSVGESDLIYRLYIHENGDVGKALAYWGKIVGIQDITSIGVSLKRHSIVTNRKNTGMDYFGLVTVKVRRSTDLNRKITGWILGVNSFIN